MLRVNFPKTRVPIARRMRNLIATKGDILTPQEHQYAQELTKEIRENINPWAEESEINSSVLADIRTEFADRVKANEPKNYKSIIRNVEDYVFKDAQYHYNVMADSNVQSKLTDVCPSSAKVLEHASKKAGFMKSIEKILGSPLDGTESWQEIENALRLNHINRKQRDFCKKLYQKAQKCDGKRVEKVIERENQIAANEAAAKQYGFWKSYDYVYNMPTV